MGAKAREANVGYPPRRGGTEVTVGRACAPFSQPQGDGYFKYTFGSTDMPMRRNSSLFCPGSMVILTGMRWTTFT